MDISIHQVRHEASPGIPDTDSELLLAFGAGHRLFGIALRVRFAVC